MDDHGDMILALRFSLSGLRADASHVSKEFAPATARGACTL
jgi:hypothetical protein